MNVLELDPALCVELMTGRYAGHSDAWESCLEWRGPYTKDGYGRARIPGRGNDVPAHRIAWVAAHGRDLREDHTVDHLCQNRACVRIEHLEEVLIGLNSYRAAESRRRRQIDPEGAEALRWERVRARNELHGMRVRVRAQGQGACAECGEGFERDGSRKYCSDACASEAHRRSAQDAYYRKMGRSGPLPRLTEEEKRERRRVRTKRKNAKSEATFRAARELLELNGTQYRVMYGTSLETARRLLAGEEVEPLAEKPEVWKPPEKGPKKPRSAREKARNLELTKETYRLQKEARELLGMGVKEYIERYGQGKGAALAIIAEHGRRAA